MSILELGAASSMVQGVKGDAETDYRTGNVNITPANIGAAAASHTHSYLPLSGGTMTGSAKFTGDRLTTTAGRITGYDTYGNGGLTVFSNGVGIKDPYNNSTSSGNNDFGWMRMQETTANSGELEIAVGDDGTETIVARQYNTSNAIVRTATLLDSSGNTSFPNQVSAGTHVKANGGYLYSTVNGNTVQIGSQNTSWCHINNSTSRPFYFSHSVHVNGDIYKYNGPRVQYVPTVLSTTETNGNLTLNSSAANFNHMRIYYRSNDSFHHSVTVVSPNNKYVDLVGTVVRSSTAGNIYMKVRTVKISANSIASGTPNSGHASYNEVYLSNNSITGSYNNNIYIYRVEAWNE